MKKHLKWGIPLLALVLLLAACSADFYVADPIEAWVVDEETGQPMEGVNVVAHWELKGGLEGGNVFGQVMVMEAVTDIKGRFHFSGWGPKLHFGFGHVRDDGPGLLFFKSGYERKGLSNWVREGETVGSFLKSAWNGKTIKLQKFNGSMKEYAKHLNHFNYDLANILGSDKDPCEWKESPQIISAMYRQRKLFETAGISEFNSIGDHLSSNEEYYSKKGCGSAKEFLKKVIK